MSKSSKTTKTTKPVSPEYTEDGFKRWVLKGNAVQIIGFPYHPDMEKRRQPKQLKKPEKYQNMTNSSNKEKRPPRQFVVFGSRELIQGLKKAWQNPPSLEKQRLLQKKFLQSQAQKP